MSKVKRLEDMTDQQLMEEIDATFRRWEQIAKDGCSDPFWEDGINMNLLRNHIINFYRILLERSDQVQLSLFECGAWDENLRPIPPMVPDKYMVPGGRYSHRLDWKNKKGK